MPRDRTVPNRNSTADRPRSGFSLPRGLIAGTFAATGLVWGLYAISPGASLLSAQVQSGIYLGLLLLTTCSRRAKVLLVRTVQRRSLRGPLPHRRRDRQHAVPAALTSSLA